LDGVQRSGSCVELEGFLRDRVPTTLITQTPVSLSLFTMMGPPSPLNSSHLEILSTNLKCDEVSVVSSFLSDLVTLSSSNIPIRKSHICGEIEWSVLRCGNQSNSLVLCANCSNYCGLAPSNRSMFPFSISCTDPPIDPVGKLSMLYLEFNELSPPPSFLSNEVESVTDTTASVSVVMSGPGSLVCRAYLSSSLPPVSSEILVLQSVAITGTSTPSSATSTSANYLLTGLVPSSTYDLYCASLSLSSIPMSTAWMLLSKMSVQTNCCRSITVKLKQLLMDDMTAIPFALSINVEAPSLEETLQLTISAYDTTSLKQKEMFSPSAVSFSSSSASLKIDLVYLPVTSGSYKLNISLLGTSQGDYKVVFPDGDVLVVKGTEDMLSPPLIQRSEFSPDGSKIIVTFTSPTNRGGALNLADCFSLFTSSLLPISSRCFWVNDSALDILSIGSSVDLGDVLSMKEGVLKARCTSQMDPTCSSWRSNDHQNTTIRSSDVVVSPVVTVSMTSEICSCDDLTLDLTSSSGSGGRPWRSFSVNVVGSSPQITFLQEYLSSLSMDPLSVRTPIFIPNSLLSSGHSYSFELTLCNFLGRCGSKRKSVVVSSSINVPVVYLNSQNLISIYRNSSLSIFGNAYTPICGAGRNSFSLSYSWTISLQKVLQSSPELQSTSVNPREFHLPPYRLKEGSLYIVKLTVTNQNSLKVSSISVQVFVKSGDLLCVLLGSEDKSLRVDGSLLLDLSGSYDTDDEDPSHSTQSSGLSFELSCFQISPSFSESCRSLLFSPLTSSLSQVLVTVNVSSLFAVTYEDKFKITMRGRSLSSSNSKKDSRNCEKVIQVSLLASLAPVVKLEVLSGPGPGFKMNPSSKLKLLGRIDMRSTGDLKWSVDDKSISLSEVSLSPVSQILGAQVDESPQVVSLVIVGNSLPEQSSFVFTLSCSLSNGYSSSSSVTITTNSPPFGGALEVVPVEGVMLETMFSLLSTQWLDEDFPMSYQFGYLSTLYDFVMLRSKMELSYTSTLLPSGFSDSRRSISNLSCVVLVFDSLDASSRSSAEVSVGEVSMPVESLESFLLSGLNTSHLANNSDELKNFLSATSTVLNRVNCSGAPDCSSLHRYQCSTVEGSCGECFSGYVGAFGFSNTRCVPLLGSSRRSLTSKMEISTIRCESDADCETDGTLFQECNHSSKSCYLIQQSCPNYCSGHGNCVFRSLWNSNVSLSECGLLDFDCVPRCECMDGYKGSSCSYSGEEFLKQTSLRALMVETVRELMSRENSDRNHLLSWIQTLASVASDSLSLSQESKELMTSLTIDILNLARGLGEVVSIEELFESGLGRLVNMCVFGFSSLSFSSISSVTEDGGSELLMKLLEVYSEVVTTDMSEGQFPVSSVTSGVRSSSFFISSTSNLTLSIPETALESLVGPSSLIHQSIELLRSQSNSLAFQISISEIQPSVDVFSNASRQIRNVSQLSSPLIVSLHGSPCSSLEGEDCAMRVFLQNRFKSTPPYDSSSKLLTTTSDSPISFETVCKLDVIETHEYVCSSGEVLTVRCNGSYSGRGRSYCPVHSQMTMCSASTSSTSGELSCRLEGYNDSVTICVCDLSQLGIIGDSGSVSFSILSVQKSVSTEFVSTWESAATLSASEVRGSWTVLLTLGTLAFFFTLFILEGMRSDSVDRKRMVDEKQQTSTVIQIKRHAFVGKIPKRARSEKQLQVMEDVKLIDESLPEIFKPNSLWVKFKQEAKVYHRWLGIVFYYSPVFPRAMRVLSLFTSIVIMLFVQSVTYNLADPDDGSCESCDDDMRCCLSLRSTLNSGEDRCTWMFASSLSSNSTLSSGSCHFRDINDDMARIFIVAVLSAAVSAPLALSVQYLISDILSKEVITAEEMNKKSNYGTLKAIQRMLPQRRVKSSSMMGLVELCGKSVFEDMKNLQNELSEYYNYYLVTENSKQEFRG
jgi:hypothetical protein